MGPGLPTRRQPGLWRVARATTVLNPSDGRRRVGRCGSSEAGAAGAGWRPSCPSPCGRPRTGCGNRSSTSWAPRAASKACGSSTSSAGSGALGVEALSRGAASATFVDLDPDALDAVRENLTAVGLADADATLVRAALPGWLRIGAAGTSTPGARGYAFDLALCDPPYDFTDWPALLEALDAATVVMESSSPIALPDTWVVARERRYGGTLITVAHHRGDAGDDRRRRHEGRPLPGLLRPLPQRASRDRRASHQALRQGRGGGRAQPPEGRRSSSTSRSARSCSRTSRRTSRASRSCRCRR